VTPVRVHPTVEARRRDGESGRLPLEPHSLRARGHQRQRRNVNVVAFLIRHMLTIRRNLGQRGVRERGVHMPIRAVFLYGNKIRLDLSAKGAFALHTSVFGKVNSVRGSELGPSARSFLRTQASNRLSVTPASRLQDNVVPLIARPITSAKRGACAARIR